MLRSQRMNQRARQDRANERLDPEDRQRYEQLREEWDKKLEEEIESNLESACLTKEDFAIRINARD